ncbi:MAG: hypothetical protein KAJ63_07720 [Methyloprofundus sp.]|nr:hypothetical protein [Methyloprofundus sp.]
MTNQAEDFLNNWANDYEESEGEISEPDFNGIEKDYSEKKEIPHYIFADGSLIIVVDTMSKRTYELCDNSSELDEEWDLECDQVGFESSIVNIFNL